MALTAAKSAAIATLLALAPTKIANTKRQTIQNKFNKLPNKIKTQLAHNPNAIFNIPVKPGQVTSTRANVLRRVALARTLSPQALATLQRLNRNTAKNTEAHFMKYKAPALMNRVEKTRAHLKNQENKVAVNLKNLMTHVNQNKNILKFLDASKLSPGKTASVVPAEISSSVLALEATGIVNTLNKYDGTMKKELAKTLGRVEKGIEALAESAKFQNQALKNNFESKLEGSLQTILADSIESGDLALTQRDVRMLRHVVSKTQTFGELWKYLSPGVFTRDVNGNSALILGVFAKFANKTLAEKLWRMAAVLAQKCAKSPTGRKVIIALVSIKILKRDSFPSIVRKIAKILDVTSTVTKAVSVGAVAFLMSNLLSLVLIAKATSAQNVLLLIVEFIATVSHPQ